jgi:hypothetical protein
MSKRFSRGVLKKEPKMNKGAKGVIMSRQMQVLAGLGAAACLALAATVAPAGAERQSFNNWHVHDGGPGTTDATGLTHRGVAFFPTIFTAGNVAAYKNDDSLLVYCPNATDKTLLHDGALPGENLRDGVCMNELYIIHLKSVPDTDVGQVPAGWTQVFHESLDSTGYTTFYMLTPR